MTTIMPHTRDQGGSAPEPEGYESWTKDELQAELEKRDLPKTGNKPELIERLEEDDAA
ncbi:MAG TPA: SAP domain-containing protein [Gemmatimonadales bacterium]|nr:SAP domain-containing protein [Gemmatimonadales bacterium]